MHYAGLVFLGLLSMALVGSFVRGRSHYAGSRQEITSEGQSDVAVIEYLKEN